MPILANNEPATYVVVSWTTLKVPISVAIETRMTKVQKEFLSLMSCHTPDDTAGFLRAVYGRVKEEQETVWLLTVWESHRALDAFEATSAYVSQREALSNFSAAPLETHRCHLDGHFWNYLSEHITITDAYFPTSNPNLLTRQAENVRGLVYFTAPGRSSPSAYTRRGNRGWVQEAQEYEGTQTKILRFMDFWKSEKAEAKFKKEQGVMIDGRFHLVHDYFEGQLKEVGCIGMRELHCKFLKIPDFFVDGQPLSDPDEEIEG